MVSVSTGMILRHQNTKIPSIGRQRCRNEPFYTCVPLSPDPFRQKRFHHLRILSHAKGLRPRVPELPGTRADGILDIARRLAGRWFE